MELLCDTYQAAQGFGFSTVPLASLALGHVTASSLLVTCAGRLKSLCWVSRSLCIFFFFCPRWKMSDEGRLVYYHTAFDLKLAYLLNLFQLAF